MSSRSSLPPNRAGEGEVIEHFDTHLAWAFVGPVMVMVVGPADPPSGAWRNFLLLCDRRMASGGRVDAVLVLPIDTAAPNAGQRAELRAMLERHRWSGPMAVIVESALAFTIVRLVAMVGGDVKPFRPTELEQALAHLGQRAFREPIIGCARGLYRQLAGKPAPIAGW